MKRRDFSKNLFLSLGVLVTAKFETPKEIILLEGNQEYKTFNIDLAKQELKFRDVDIIRNCNFTFINKPKNQPLFGDKGVLVFKNVKFITLCNFQFK